MNLFCIGLNHKVCPVDIREKFAFTEAELSHASCELNRLEGVRESFVLSTCNRVELYAHGTGGIENKLIRFLSEYHKVDKSIFVPYLYRFSDLSVVEHLFRVSSGLDSLVIGENEIYGQVRRAFRRANELKTLDSILYQVVERSIRVGKRVRAETQINDRAVSVSTIAVELARKIFGDLSEERILVLGTGKMSGRSMTHLVDSGARHIVVASRTYARALEMAQKFGAEPIGFDSWFRALEISDIVISSTAAPNPIIQYEDIRQLMKMRRHKPLCFIDIAVPRDVDPRVGEIDDVYLYDIDDLKSVSEANLRLRKKEMERCENLIDREVGSFEQWHEYLEARPVVQRLTAYLDEVIEREIQKSRGKFKGKEKELDQLMHKVKASFLHMPLQKLKEAAKFGRVERYLETLHSLFGLGEKTESKDVKPVQRHHGRSEESRVRNPSSSLGGSSG